MTGISGIVGLGYGSKVGDGKRESVFIGGLFKGELIKVC
jgi:hypothetical protein